MTDCLLGAFEPVGSIRMVRDKTLPDDSYKFEAPRTIHCGLYVWKALKRLPKNNRRA
jgi:hypothetical protein